MTAFQLKIIALITMLIDHIGALFSLPFYLRCIGRISFPLYAFLIAEGCKYTKNIKKYLFRIGIFALISEIPFDLAFQKSFLKINFFSSTNIFYTLFLGILSIYVYKKFKETYKHIFPAFICIIIIAALANLLTTDYGAFGVILIFLIYYVKQKKYQIIVMAIGFIFQYLYTIKTIFYTMLAYLNKIFNINNNFLDFRLNFDNIMLFGFNMLPLIFIYLYNNKKGRNVKWLFYVFYPLHLFILYLISCFIN